MICSIKSPERILCGRAFNGHPQTDDYSPLYDFRGKAFEEENVIKAMVFVHKDENCFIDRQAMIAVTPRAFGYRIITIPQYVSPRYHAHDNSRRVVEP